MELFYTASSCGGYLSDKTDLNQLEKKSEWLKKEFSWRGVY